MVFVLFLLRDVDFWWCFGLKRGCGVLIDCSVDKPSSNRGLYWTNKTHSKEPYPTHGVSVLQKYFGCISEKRLECDVCFFTPQSFSVVYRVQNGCDWFFQEAQMWLILTFQCYRNFLCSKKGYSAYSSTYRCQQKVYKSDPNFTSKYPPNLRQSLW